MVKVKIESKSKQKFTISIKVIQSKTNPNKRKIFHKLFQQVSLKGRVRHHSDSS